MTQILITGMSGTGKTSVIEELSRRGFRAVDTDSDEWSEWTLTPEETDWIWREDKMQHLLTSPHQTPLFVCGCKTNQGRLYVHFDHAVLLSAPLEVMLERIARRTNNPYGQRPEEREQIVQYVQSVEPLLRRGASLELDTSTMTVSEVADQVMALTVPAQTEPNAQT